ncbi:IclR family transcriptional regulator [Nocardioides sp. GY 10127]|uniref:IclR family transcriptional regulator n=1 Tax=Nocardioides sp. GY 10127 TaxID=2569762 RepID=UPI0010A8D45D|nr:IclR family transcriptional regulator [Nocardioides sp. GY 10127]TIC81766.1 IclR family transcriptional regulator [Nocardioides sp. GY 10127]
MTSPPTERADRVRPGALQSVSTAAEVLVAFLGAEDLGVSEVARRLGVAKSTAHRTLSTLAESGLLVRSSVTGRYRLGLRMYELGQVARDREPLHRAALPLLERLHARTGLTVHLAVADGAHVVFVERLHGASALPILGASARRVPAHLTAVGKALAAFDPRVAAAAERAGLAPATDSSVTGPEEWAACLERVRRDGWARARDESVEGLSSVAVPVRAQNGPVVCAISVAGSTGEVDARLGGLVQELRAAATGVGQRLVAPERDTRSEERSEVRGDAEEQGLTTPR